MAISRRNGMRKKRETKIRTRVPDLGYYFIVTDTKKTEENYMKGLRDSIPAAFQSKIVIKVSKAETKKLVEEAKSLAALQPQYGEPWIVFDRDQVKDFDEIIQRAVIEGINAGWSNPCIEIWFSAYFGSMPTDRDSVTCCAKFRRIFKNKTKKEYEKSERNIYNLLCDYGDEIQAMKIADLKLSEQKKINDRPSDMCPSTTLHFLIREIREKTKDG